MSLFRVRCTACGTDISDCRLERAISPGIFIHHPPLLLLPVPSKHMLARPGIIIITTKDVVGTSGSRYGGQQREVPLLGLIY